ncbi:MAG: phosphoenolpyruvate carboxylase [Deltaproteobacteria bacterium]|nr:MAG: phosphoenolpyruvate carboxylase [Deltaproteobacteria bacterium]
MTSSATQLIMVHKKSLKALPFEKSIFDKALMKPTDLEVIPLIEGTASLIQSRQILKEYIRSYEDIFGVKPKYLRPFIARSDPALDAGYLAAILSARGAISEYYLFKEETHVPVFPMIGVGSLAFRGGLSPLSLERFFKNYAGIRTVTIQSAFRYDYPIEIVKKAIQTLESKLPKLKPKIFDKNELEEISFLDHFFASYYRPVILSLAETIKQFAPFIPSHRERIQHTGHFGYSRKMGNTTALPRAITFSGVFYSLGIPPGLIGSGRALKALQKKQKGNFDKTIRKYFPTLEEDLVEMGAYMNWENIKLLAKKNSAWSLIQEDILAIEDLLGKDSFQQIQMNIFIEI